MMDEFKYVQENDFDVEEIPHGWIQWKGMNSCVDLHCKCGYLGHVDKWFFYFYKCPNCETCYAVGQNIKLIEINDQEIINSLEEEGRLITCSANLDKPTRFQS